MPHTPKTSRDEINSHFSHSRQPASNSSATWRVIFIYPRFFLLSPFFDGAVTRFFDRNHRDERRSRLNRDANAPVNGLLSCALDGAVNGRTALGKG